MADVKQDHKGEDVDSYGMGNSADPKNMQELTQYVQTLLQNMQDKFQTMSDQIIGRNMHVKFFAVLPSSLFISEQILDEMGNRIDDLEKNIADLMTQAGVEGGDK
ncbi:Heat shock factor-binding protein 1 [Trachymyrmex cornetzi]|uniref:Heat shock factor-binding protein 1 n=1 Tax=Trachymyrmex cornetzi TaxID=471704 RepID=A0A195DA13_9HYME|nr:Heat shock factor-binding protein 1 [Trachymyrmex cornetzi]